MDLMDEQESPSADRPLNTITVAGRELLLVEHRQAGGGADDGLVMKDQGHQALRAGQVAA